MKEAALSPTWKISVRVILSLKAAGSEENLQHRVRRAGAELRSSGKAILRIFVQTV